MARTYRVYSWVSPGALSRTPCADLPGITQRYKLILSLGWRQIAAAAGRGPQVG